MPISATAAATSSWVERGLQPVKYTSAPPLARTKPRFAVLASKLLTLHEMSVIWRTNPSRFDSLMSSLASESGLPNTLTFQLVTEAFYGMANESFSALLRDAYPAPTERQFTQIQD